ncbi:MAG TPA: hypothetical protein VH277_05205 [Gemmatimonadaceae bacterium]|nr:hypothetical protein [Gemmatimonadaceae bacterium]
MPTVFDSWNLRIPERLEFSAMNPRAQLELFASVALLAPTTHNTVPQRIRIDCDRSALHLALDRRAILPQSDAAGRQATISLGAAISNVLIAAEAYGAHARMTFDAEARPRPARDGEIDIERVATIVFGGVQEPSRDLDWMRAIARRKMVRAEFDERLKLEPVLADTMHSTVRRVHPGLMLHLITDSPTLLALGKFQELADSTVINRAPFARELADWLEENDSERAVGMRGREFGLSDDAARRFKAGLAGRGPLLPDETAAFAKAGNVGMRSSSAVAVITVANDNVEHRLAAGRAFEELALLLTMADYAVAMHAGITEVEGPNRALRGRLRTLQRPTVVFRTGKPLREPDAERPHSARPSLQEVLY